MEEHKVQKKFIRKLLEKAGVIEKKNYRVFDQVERIYVGKKVWKIKLLRKIGKKVFSYVAGFLLRLMR